MVRTKVSYLKHLLSLQAGQCLPRAAQALGSAVASTAHSPLLRQIGSCLEFTALLERWEWLGLVTTTPF